MPSRLTWLIRNKIEKRSCFGGFFFYGGNCSILGLKAASGVGLTALRAEAGRGARIGAAVFPKGPAPSAQRGVWHPSGLPALGAKGCIKGLRRFAQGKRPWLAPLKKKGRPYDKTIQPPENKPTALRARKCTPIPALRDFSTGKRLTRFSVAQGLPTNRVRLPPRRGKF